MEEVEITAQRSTSELEEKLSLTIESLSIDAIKNTTPVVTFDVGGLSEVVSGTNGILIPAFEVKQMSKALLELSKSRLNFSFDAEDVRDYDWKLGAEKMLNYMNVKAL